MRREKGGFWIAFCAVFFYPTGWLAGRSRFEGLEHIPARGGALVVANHLSHLDPVFTGLIVHRARRVPRFLAKHSLWSVPVLGQALRGTGQIPVYRDSADAQRSLREGTRGPGRRQGRRHLPGGHHHPRPRPAGRCTPAPAWPGWR